MRAAWAILLVLSAAWSAAGEQAVLDLTGRSWQRPLRSGETFAALSEVLAVDLGDLAAAPLPPLPAVWPGSGDIPAAYRALITAAVARVFDSRSSRPLTRRWRLGLGRGGVIPGQREVLSPTGAESIFATAAITGEIASWPEESACCGGERGLGPVTVGRITIPDAGTWRVSVTASHAGNPYPVRFQPCVVALGSNGKPLVRRALPMGASNLVIEADLTVAAGQTLELVIGEESCAKTSGSPAPDLRIESIELEGPLFPFAGWPSPAEQRVLFTSLFSREDPAYLDAVVRRFLLRAWRREPSRGELWSMRSRIAIDRIKPSLAAMMIEALQAPQFLYVEERTGLATGQTAKLGSSALAARIAFGLFGTTPSDALREDAQTGRLWRVLSELPDPNRKNAQDPEGPWNRLSRLGARPGVAGFGQRLAESWFDLAALEAWNRDPALRPGWANAPGRDLRDEISWFLDAAIQPAGRILALVQADRIPVNRTLIRHYGLTGIDAADPLIGDGITPLPITPGHGRCGLPTLGGLLALACDGRAERTAQRGAAMWRMCFGDPARFTESASEIADLDRLLAPYDAIGRWSAVGDGPWDTKPLREWFKPRRQRLAEHLVAQLIRQLVGYPALPGDPLIRDIVPSEKADPDLRQVLCQVLAHPRFQEMW